MDVAQLEAHVVWDHGAAGSSPAIRTTEFNKMLVSSSAKIDQFRDTTEKVDHFVNLSERPISFRYLWTKYVVRARDICEGLGYKTWRNFNGLIEKAIQLINSGCEHGIILKTEKPVKIGFGAVRNVLDYELDADAVNILGRISSYKLNKDIRLRNETVILTMVKKYCDLKEIPFDFQVSIDGYKYDCCVNHNILIEFDEQHHCVNRQQATDESKNAIATLNGYKIFRFDIYNDIIDIIDTLDRCVRSIDER